MIGNYPYNLFLTKLILTPANINSFENIFSKHNYQSILILFSSEIDDFIKINKLDINKLKKFNSLQTISNIYQDLLNDKNIELFCKKIIYKKKEFDKIYNNIHFFLESSNKQIDFIYENPIHYHFLEDVVSTIKLSINNNYKNNQQVDISLDILLQYEYINLSLPSCGLVTSILSSNVNTYIHLINVIMNNNNILYNITKDLPFQNLDIPNILTNILFKNIMNDELKNITLNILKNVEVKLKDIFYDKKINNNNNNNNNNINTKKYTINKEYIIPYDIYKNKIIPLKSYKNIKTYKDLMTHNNNLLFYVLKKIYNDGKENLKYKKYKNVLAYYLFNIIRIIYNICKKYIDELDISLTNITIANKNTFGKLNLKDAFDYTFLLSKSLYNFKLILLNNFYHLFLPKRIDKGYYGMYKNNNGSFVIQQNSIFMGDDIYKNYPIQKFNEKDNMPFRLNSNKLFENFILKMKSKVDIYDRNNKLEYGGKVFNENIMRYTNKLLINYFHTLKNSCLFNIFIIEKIIYFFKIKKSIPLELVEDFISIYRKLLLSMYNNSSYFISSITIKYEDLINKCKEYYLNYRITFNKKNEENKLISIIYFLKSIFLLNMVKNLTKDFNLKRNILFKFDNIKKKYEKFINNKLLL